MIYLAALLDVLGSVYISWDKATGKLTSYIKVSSNDARIPDWLYSTTNVGNVVKSGKRRTWVVTGENVTKILENVIAYSVFKKETLSILLAFGKRQRSGWTKQRYVEDVKAYYRIKELNGFKKPVERLKKAKLGYSFSWKNKTWIVTSIYEASGIAYAKAGAITRAFTTTLPVCSPEEEAIREYCRLFGETEKGTSSKEVVPFGTLGRLETEIPESVNEKELPSASSLGGSKESRGDRERQDKVARSAWEATKPTKVKNEKTN